MQDSQVNQFSAVEEIKFRYHKLNALFNRLLIVESFDIGRVLSQVYSYEQKRLNHYASEIFNSPNKGEIIIMQNKYLEELQKYKGLAETSTQNAIDTINIDLAIIQEFIYSYNKKSIMPK